AHAERAPLARPSAGPAVRPLRVLLVEDNEPTLRVLTRLLEGLGHRVAAARGGTFDLLLSDVGLPDGSGLDLMRAVREQFAGRAIALTGYGMEEDVRRCREAGFAAHLTKPVDLRTLEDAVRRVVERG
ncbi:MAG: multi-sensor hybrid histidine kinase, partial [Phycisphaerales bacterium]|nr:multi-sensor hybrid histidine kinase [Phycisphaerales bacterium]